MNFSLRLFAGLISIFFLIMTYNSCDYQPYKQGKNLYDFYCATCHMDDGTGLGQLYPPLAASDYLAANQSKLACLIRNGIADSIVVNGVTYQQQMKGIIALNEVQITNVINYINHSWGNEMPHVKVKEISAQLNNCPITN